MVDRVDQGEQIELLLDPIGDAAGSAMFIALP
jgi:hypothetical protein